MQTLREHIASAIAGAPGDSEKALDVLRLFCEAADQAADNDIMPDVALLEYIATAFRCILDGGDARDALNLRRQSPRGRTSRHQDKTEEEDFHLALAVARCMASGMKKADAYAYLANSRITIKSQWTGKEMVPSQTVTASLSRIKQAYEGSKTKPAWGRIAREIVFHKPYRVR